MSIQKVLGSRISKLEETTNTLRMGQILQGKINKLYPNNKAQVQLGTNQLIAQLEASLEIGERYHFQVKGTEGVIRLKIVGDAFNNQNQSSMMELFSYLGMKPTKERIMLVELLIQNKIPFDKKQLHHAFSLLEGGSNKSQARTILMEMIANRMELSYSVFQSLLARRTQPFSEGLVLMEKELQQNQQSPPNVKNEILNRLNSLTGKQIQHLPLQSMVENPEIVDFLKAVRIIHRDTVIPELVNQGKSLQNESNSNLSQPANLINVQAILNNFSNLNIVAKHAASILDLYGQMIQERIITNTPLPNDQFNRLMQEVEQRIFQKLQLNDIKISNTTQQLHFLLQDLNALAKSDNQANMSQFVHQLAKHSFHDQLQNVLHLVGLQYENKLLQEDSKQADTLKGMLLTLIQTSEGKTNQQAQRIVQLINGLQLDSVHETDRFLQANIVIPLKNLGIEKEVELTFEGKKDESGKIDPNYCRIVFYLELSTIEKTVIDMNVQKRAVSITVLNDNHLNSVMSSFKPILKRGLEKLDYHLSSVTWQPLTEHVSASPTNDESKIKTPKPTYLGVDYRI